jgi:hypothetical protein
LRHKFSPAPLLLFPPALCPPPLAQRIRTWLRSDLSADEKEGLKSIIDDSAELAGLEGLFGHQAAALQRRKFL